MHLLGVSLFLAYLLYSNFASDSSHSDYYEYNAQEQMDEPVSSENLFLGERVSLPTVFERNPVTPS